MKLMKFIMQQHDFSRAGVAIAALIITFGLIGGAQAQTRHIVGNPP